MPLLDRLVVGLLGGIAGLVLALGVGVVRALLILISGGSVNLDGLWPDFMVYATGWLLGGMVLALAWPLRERRFGAYVVGMLGIGCFTATILAATSGPPWAWKLSEWLGLGLMTIVLGAGLGLALGRAERA